MLVIPGMDAAGINPFGNLRRHRGCWAGGPLLDEVTTMSSGARTRPQMRVAGNPGVNRTALDRPQQKGVGSASSAPASQMQSVDAGAVVMFGCLPCSDALIGWADSFSKHFAPLFRPARCQN